MAINISTVFIFAFSKINFNGTNFHGFFGKIKTLLGCYTLKECVCIIVRVCSD